MPSVGHPDLVAPGQDDPRRSWAWGLLALTGLGLFGWLSGACARLSEVPVLRSGHGAGFWLAVAGCLAVEVVAYGVVWPIGTWTLGRPRTLWSPLFGLLWGVTEGLVFLGAWELTAGLPTLGRAAVAWLACSAFQGGWHAGFWDRHVSPPHNDPTWNGRKVLLAHVPNLTASTAFLALTEEPWPFVGFQVVALVLSASAMRFPKAQGRASVDLERRSA